MPGRGEGCGTKQGPAVPQVVRALPTGAAGLSSTTPPSPAARGGGDGTDHLGSAGPKHWWQKEGAVVN